MSSITGVSAADTPVPDDDPHEGGPEDRTPAGDGASTGRLGDKIFSALASGAGILVVALVTLVGAFLVIQAIPALADNDSNFLLS